MVWGTGFDAAESALAEAEAAYASRNPVSSQLHLRAHAHMPGGNTRSALYWSPFPLYVTASEGCHVVDADGHRYLDALGEYSAGLYGHSDAVIAAAISRTLANGMSNGAPGVGELRLAELICGRFPSVERIRFCNSGTEANLYALSLARAATGRQRLLGFAGAYHGGVLSFPSGGNRLNAPFDWTLCRYNDADATRAAIDGIGSDLAALIVEPMMSNGGCIAADPQFLAMLRARCDAVGALLIFDEIVTSRMGEAGMQGLTGVSPDLTTFGKYLGAGFSFGAFGGRAGVMALMDPARGDALIHAGTFNNNVFSMTAGADALEQVFTPARALRLQSDGDALRARLDAVAAALSPAIRFTGAGSVMNVHFRRGPIRAPQDLADEPRALIRLFHLDLLGQGVSVAPRGQINLSLPMAQGDFDRIATAVETVLTRRVALIDALVEV
jgi:glutamate-1-semialdehyde 2,1-aminomutase